MEKQEAQQKIDQFNELTTYGESRDEYEKIVRELADEGYGVRWDASSQEYTLTNVPDLSVLS
jgi:hypothetical protein